MAIKFPITNNKPEKIPCILVKTANNGANIYAIKKPTHVIG